MSCLHCYAETTNGLALCERCRVKASVDLTYLPVYFRNLARWQPGRAGSRAVPGSRIPEGVLPSRGDRVQTALDEVGNDLTTWARALADDRPRLARLLDRLAAADLSEAEVMGWLCRGFERYLTSIGTLEWAGEFATRIGDHERRLRALTERVAPGWYAGACRRCGYATHVIPGFTWVTCGACGATTYARDHLDTVLDEARGWVARPKPLAEAVVAMVDTEASVPRLYDRIRKWANGGDIEPVWRTERGYEWSDSEKRLVVAEQTVGHARYRLGQVLDLVLRETRALREVRAS